MGVQTGKANVLGRQQKWFAKAETTAFSQIKPTATDAIKAETSMMKSDEASEAIVDNSDHRYDTESIEDKITNTWSFNGYIIPSGTPATEPDMGPMFKCAMGADNSGAGSKWIYTIASIQAWPTLSIYREFNGIWSQAMWGAWINSMTIKLASGSQPRVTFEGGAGDYAYTGPSTLNGDMGRAGNITAVADAGGGQLTISSTAHGLVAGNKVTVRGTTSYNGSELVVANPTADTFEITDTFVASETGSWLLAGAITAVADGGAGTVVISSANHGVSDGEEVTISGCVDPNYNGTFTVSGAVLNVSYKITATWGATDTGNWVSGSTTMIVQTVDKWQYAIGSIVSVDGENNGGAGYKVTAESSRPSFTLEALVAGADGDAVAPYVPTPTYTGSPIAGVLATIQVADEASTPQTIIPTDVEVKLENNHDVFGDEVGAQKVTDFAPDKCKVTVTIGLRMRQDWLQHLANARAFTTRDISIVFGNVAGKRINLDIDYGKAVSPDFTIPQDKSGTAKLVYTGYGSGANGPLIITFD